jgi:hypothetical protein
MKEGQVLAWRFGLGAPLHSAIADRRLPRHRQETLRSERVPYGQPSAPSRVPMTKSRFDYKNNRWAGGNAAVARRWYKELERANPENVRASLDQTAGSRGAIPIGEVSMTIGFARDWLAWHDQQKAVREAKFRRWQFIASASVLLAAIGLALKAWLKW